MLIAVVVALVLTALVWIMTVDADCTVQLDSALDDEYFGLSYKDLSV